MSSAHPSLYANMLHAGHTVTGIGVVDYSTRKGEFVYISFTNGEKLQAHVTTLIEVDDFEMHDDIQVGHGMYVCEKCGYGYSALNMNDVCPGKPKNARQRRERGIGLVLNSWAPIVDETLTEEQATSIAAEIRELASLGRTERWKNGCELWARMVETERVRFWVLQGSINQMHMV